MQTSYMDRPLFFFFLEGSFSVDPFILGVGTEEKTSCGTPGGEEGGCGAGFDGEDFRDVDVWDLSVGNLELIPRGCGFAYVTCTERGGLSFARF